MDNLVTLPPSGIVDFLLEVAPHRPVMLWGPPGVGKSAVVQRFSADVGLPCVTLLGSQLAPEDLLGVPQLLPTGRSRFCPPTLIARDEPYTLFLDEINLASAEVLKAFYSLIQDRRLGEWEMPEGSIIIAAGNRATDSALVQTLPAPLINRMVHVGFGVSTDEWLGWARTAQLHQDVVSYIETRPDHLRSNAPRTQEPFSTPRSWHLLSDALQALGATAPRLLIEAAVTGSVTPSHAAQFLAFLEQQDHRWLLSRILKGDASWPLEAKDLPLLQFLVGGFRAHLIKRLPADRSGVSGQLEQDLHRWKALISQLADVYEELAHVVVARAEDGTGLPTWFLSDLVRDLPRLASRAMQGAAAD